LSAFESIALFVLGALAFAFLWWAHVAFWRAFLAPRDRPDEIHNVRTEDGWRIALRRYRPRGDGPRFVEPVILCHGLGANHYNVDWDPPYGLAQALAARGRDCFVISLRAHHGSDRPSVFNDLRWGFSFDDYLRYDVTAAIDYVLRITGAPRAQWVGHSMGGIFAYAMGGTPWEQKISGGIVAVGSPATFAHQRYLVGLVRLGSLLAGRSRVRKRWLSHVLAPFSGFFDPPFSELVIAPRSMEGKLIRRLQAHVFEDISAGVMRQFEDWVTSDSLRSLDERRDYRDSMREIRSPVLLIGGSRDRMAPPACMEAAFREIRAEDKTLLLFGKDRGSRADYGHGDLLLGIEAPNEVFPAIEAWLRARATPVARAEAAAG
jgi:pimeloyl-ACP methyl ester carboxylesterase